MNEENVFFKERLNKLSQIEGMGVSPFGGRFPKSQLMAETVASYQENKKVTTAGRLTALRLMGKTAFCDLRDESGKIQLYLKPDALPENERKLFELLDLGDLVGVTGELFKTKTGETTLRVSALTLLSKSLRPLPEKWHGLKDVETRYRQRYLDLISNEDVKDIFRRRSLVIREIRNFLDGLGYLEVETPMMQPIPGGAAGKPFKTHHQALDLDLYLRVAPELYLKRLLVGGFDKVYEINKSFRNEGISTRHNPEFTMLEAYTAYHDVEDVMNLTQQIIQKAARSVFGALVSDRDGTQWDLSCFERVSFAALMEESFGIRPEDDTPVWIEKLKKKGVDVKGKNLSRTQVINLVADLLEPGKGSSSGALRPYFVTDYFAELSPLAKRRPNQPFLSERFELYIGGMEIANGYSEQNNPIEQRQRLVEELKQKGKEKEEGALDEDFLLALEHGMPPAGGLGIGIDRLVMVLTGQSSIREVIFFPQMKKES